MFTPSISITLCAILGCLCGQATLAVADTQPTPEESLAPVALSEVSAQELSDRLKVSVLRILPTEMAFDARDNWGHQTQIPFVQGVKVTRIKCNHGDWEKARVVTSPLPRDLRVRVYNLQSLDDNRISYTLYLSTPATVKLNKQVWQDGIKVYSARVRARFKLSAALTITMTPARPDKDSSLERRWSLRITRATFTCDDFVAENINGLGGDFAKLTKPHRNFWPWQPAVLAEFEKTALTAAQALDADSDLQAISNRLRVQGRAARAAAQRAYIVASDRPAATSAAPCVFAAPMPVPLLAGITIEIPSGGREVAQAKAPHKPSPSEHGEQHDHWSLAPHSIHYQAPVHEEHSNHSPTNSAESAHRR
jgi:hypothetical protein